MWLARAQVARMDGWIMHSTLDLWRVVCEPVGLLVSAAGFRTTL